MVGPETGLIGIAAFVGLLVLGMPIAFAAAITGFVGLWAVAGWTPATTLTSMLPHSVTATYAFAVLPLFILMGHTASACGYTQDIYAAARLWLGRLPGGLAVATVGGGAGFAAACGSSVASAAVLTKVSLPEMRRQGYQTRFSVGSIAVGGLLATIIPPSNMVVMYGIIAEQSIGKLLVAAIIPGLLMALFFCVTIILRAWLNPSLGKPIYGVTWRERFVSLRGAIGIIILGLVVMVGIYSGATTPVEAGGVGAVGAILLGAVSRRLTWAKLWGALLETARTTSMIFIILVGVFILNTFLGFVGLPALIAQYLVGLDVSTMYILFGILLLYLVLGTFMEGIGILILTLPIFVPSLVALGLDPVWFGILVILMMEIGMITPPIGMVIIAMKGGAPDVSLENIYWGVAPMLPAALLVVVLVVIFPELALFLPSQMGR